MWVKCEKYFRRTLQTSLKRRCSNLQRRFIFSLSYICHTSSDIRIIRVLIETVAEMHSCINNYHPGVGKSCTRIGLSCRLSSERDAM